MRKVFLDDLPRYDGYDGKNIRWSCSIGYELKFIFDDYSGVFKIIDYDIVNAKVKVEYLENEYILPTKSVIHGNISNILGLIDCTQYDVGQVLELKNTKIKILEFYDRSKGHHKRRYKVLCLTCGNQWFLDNKAIRDKVKCVKCTKNKFNISDDGTYWIGMTQSNEEFWFDGDEETIKYIKSFTWRKNKQGYFQNRNGERLHRVVMKEMNPNVYINHLGGDRKDNRKSKLTISNSLDNSKEKKISSRNNSGIVGLMARGKNKNRWVGNIKINNINLYTKYKAKDEAIIDLLIMQRHFGFRHNENMYHMLSDISQERVGEVLENVYRQFNTVRNDKIGSSNIYELSECCTYYKVYDKNNKCFKISIENKDKVQNGVWHVSYDKSNNSTYVHGTIVVEGKRKIVKLHRYIFDLLDIRYKNIFVDHLNGDVTDNRLCNLLLTDANGNAKNKPALGYSIRCGKYRAGITINGKKTTKTFETEEEAVEWFNYQREKSMNNRLKFKSKEEVDEYLHNKNN